YLVAAPVSVRRRVAQLTLACAAMVASAGWWIAIVELWPAASRPYIGGSQGNSVLELIFGYNGFGRLTGNETGSVGGAGGQAGRWGATGLTRMFGTEFGTQISWLLPAALILLGAGIAWRGRLARTDRVRAAFILWGGWLLVTGIVFSLGKGIIHPYYSVALAPAIGALVGMGGFGGAANGAPTGGPPNFGGANGGFPGATGGTRGGAGGLLNGSTPSRELTELLGDDSGAYTWVAATIGANQAAGYQLATG